MYSEEDTGDHSYLFNTMVGFDPVYFQTSVKKTVKCALFEGMPLPQPEGREL